MHSLFRQRGELHLTVEVPQIYALTILDPWCWAIDALPAAVAKPVENRYWPPYPWIRGHRWLAVHVGQSWCGEEARSRIAQLSGVVPPSRFAREMTERRGRVTGMVRIDGTYPADGPPRKWHAPGQFGWEIGARVCLARPVAVTGRQKVWRVPIPAAVQIVEQLPRDVLDALAHPAVK